MRNVLRTALWGVALATLLGGTACQRLESEPVRPTEVRVAEITAGAFDETITFVGTLRARRRASLASVQPGTVVRVDVTDGDTVAAGQPLVWLETRDTEARIREQEAALEGARANEAEVEASLHQSEAQLRNGVEQAQETLRQSEINVASVKTQTVANQRDMERLRTLYKENAVSRSQKEQAELKYKLSLDDLKTALSRKASAEAALRLAQKGEHDVASARAKLAVAHAQVTQAQASLEAARVSLQESVLKAPIAGTIVDRNVEPGQAVGGGATPLLAVVDNATLECVTAIEEQHADRIRRGMPANITTPLSRDRSLRAEVLELVPSSDPKTNTLRMRLRILNPDNLLMDGLSINGRLTLTEHRGATVPREAVRTMGQKSYVHLVEGQSVHRREVNVSYTTETHALITGVSEGQFVVIDGNNLTDGQTVTIDYTPATRSAAPAAAPSRPRAR